MGSRRFPRHRRFRSGQRRRHFRRRRHLPLSDLRQMGRRLQESDRHRPELSVDRLRRRHQADPGQDRDLRRFRRAASGQGARPIRPGAVPHGHGRHRAGRERRPASSRANSSSTARRSPRSSRRDHQVERRRSSRSSTRPPSCRMRRSPSCIARTVRAPPSTSPTICPTSAPTGSRRSATTPRLMAGRHRRQGQRRRRQQRRQHQELDRLRRVCLCDAEQADLHQDDEQGRQDRCPDLGSFPGRGCQCQLEVAARLRRDPRQPARCDSPGR